MSPLRVLVVDYQTFTAVALSHELDKSQFFVLPEQAKTLALAQTACRQEQPDILLLAWQLAKPFVAASLAPFRQHQPTLPIILLGEGTPPPDLVEAGVTGYFCRDDMPETWRRCFRTVAAGHLFFSQNLAEGKGGRPVKLSIREDALVQLLQQGCCNQEMADRLNVSVSTVEKNLTRLYQKLGVNSRSEAQAWGWHVGIMDGGEPQQQSST